MSVRSGREVLAFSQLPLASPLTTAACFPANCMRHACMPHGRQRSRMQRENTRRGGMSWEHLYGGAKPTTAVATTAGATSTTAQPPRLPSTHPCRHGHVCSLALQLTQPHAHASVCLQNARLAAAHIRTVVSPAPRWSSAPRSATLRLHRRSGYCGDCAAGASTQHVSCGTNTMRPLSCCCRLLPFRCRSLLCQRRAPRLRIALSIAFVHYTAED